MNIWHKADLLSHRRRINDGNQYYTTDAPFFNCTYVPSIKYNHKTPATQGQVIEGQHLEMSLQLCTRSDRIFLWRRRTSHDQISSVVNFAGYLLALSPARSHPLSIRLVDTTAFPTCWNNSRRILSFDQGHIHASRQGSERLTVPTVLTDRLAFSPFG